MGATPCLIVRGEIASEVGLNSGCGALGSGSRANATIGRCVKLVLGNIGEAKLGGTESTTLGMLHDAYSLLYCFLFVIAFILCTLGTPMKFTFCVAENEKAKEKYQFDTDVQTENTVTAISVTSGT